MLAHRDRGWSIIRESLRRERRVNDILNASGAARLTRRVAVTGTGDPSWKGAEVDLRRIEHEIRLLDPIGADFWTRYRELEDRLVARFAEAGVTFEVR